MPGEGRGSLSYKIRSQQALRNKPREPELPALPPRADGGWEGGGGMGAAASEPAGLLPRGQGWGAAACPPPPGAEEIPAARGGPRKGAEYFWGDGKRWQGG